MNSRCEISRLTAALSSFFIRSPRESGNILVYVVMVMVIFAVLGVAMVSLFSTSISSSATPNDTRRAFYNYESGLRYAASELVNNTPKFSPTTIDKLNTTTYKIAADGTFKLKIFGLDFQSLSEINDDTILNVNLKVDKGLLPADFTIPITEPHIFLVIYDTKDPGISVADPLAAITGFTYQDSTHVNLDLEDPIYVGNKDQVAFAVRPFQGNPISQGGDLLLTRNAASIFPRKNGVIEVREGPALIDEKKYYFYDDRIDVYDTGNKLIYAKLTNIQNSNKSSFTLNVSSSSSYVLLSPAIHIVTAEGKSSEVTYTEKWYNQYGGSVYDRDYALGLSPKSRKPDIAFGEEDALTSAVGGLNAPSNPSYITANNFEKSIVISGSSGLGAAWFRDTRPIGGIKDYCQNGKCLFGKGIRVFFTLEYSGSGDGLIFSLINGASNSKLSIGGELEAAELLGYSGDGRLNAGGTQFIEDSTRNLNPPKIGLEFDTKVNFSDEFEKTVNYCSGSNLKENTRNDPGSTGRDAIQYVFWGNSALDIPCRDNNPSYDDNRHDATGPGPDTEDWKNPTGNSINTSPALSPDSNTVYIGSGNNLIAYDAASGETKWSYSTGGRISSSPTVAYLGPEVGTIYLGSQDGYLYAITDGGLNATLRWRYPTNTEGKNFGVVNTKPVVGEGGAIYFASNNEGSGFKFNYFFALKPDNSQKWTALPNPRGPNNTYAISPALSLTGAYVYLATTSGTIFRINTTTGDFNNFVSIPSNINFAPPDPLNENVFSPSIGPDGNIYVGAGNQIYAITPSGSASPFPTGSNPISSSPTAGPDGLVYVGNYDRSLYAVDTKGLGRGWSYPTGMDINSQPTVDANGHIYFGSNDNYVYALYSDGRLKWKYLTGGDVRGRPEVRANGSVYIGSFDNDFYAINQFANPKNFKKLRITSTSSSTVAGFNEAGTIGEQLSVVLGTEYDWLKGALTKGPWAVRMEVDRKLTSTNSYYEYTLRTWLRQCSDSNCANIYGTFFEDTRVDYPTNIRPHLIEQTIRLSSDEHDDFNRFLFGFTSATKALETQSATIRNFQLSFKRDNDPTATKNPAVDPDPNLP